jgi:hypothetical protein
MTLQELIDEFTAVRRPGWLVLGDEELTQFGVEACRFYGGYGDIRSISSAGRLQAAGEAAPATEPDMVPALPIRDPAEISGETALTVGEWAVIRPLFLLYVERENALRLEASRASGLEVFGRSVSEVNNDITQMENEVLPAKAFSYAVIEVS